MCGFSGVTFSNLSSRDNYPFTLDVFRRSSSRIAHRGDTEHREFISDLAWLSHYRLAFQDVQAGAQPMPSQDGRHIIVFNGEVYNHLQLRKKIQQAFGFQFRTRSDTETILEGWKLLGDDFFKEFDGEYAFIIIDLATNQLLAHRDYYGVKPLFLRLPGLNTRVFSVFRPRYKFETLYLEFASEIKGLPGKKTWQKEGLLRQFVGLYEPVCTPFENVIQLPPGALLTVKSLNNVFHCQLTTNSRPIRYTDNPVIATEEEFEHVFREAVSNRLLSDVELGVYLSGGVDSKSVAYELAREKQQSGLIKSFTVGFVQEGYDETEEALSFARHTGFLPHVLHVDDEALNYSYPIAVQSSELVQPFTNGAAKWWLSLFARQYVQGVLTGDGADEVFCGYPSYRYTNWWRFAMRGRGKASNSAEVHKLLQAKPLGQSMRDSLYISRFSAHHKNPWLSGSSAEGDGSDFIQSLATWGVAHPLFGQVQAITHALLGAEEGNHWLAEQGESIRSLFAAGLPGMEDELANPEHALLLWQNYFSHAHLPVLILNWVGDRMEMSNTLEGRTPFLSKPVYDLMSRQKDKMLVHGLRDKVMLRRTFARLLPEKFVLTPKKQFNAPLLDSNSMIERYQAGAVLEKTGICPNATLTGLLEQAKVFEQENPYYATHLKTAHQTAISLGMVDYCIAEDLEINRDRQVEEKYLADVIVHT